jgi:hypothetical protein
LFSFAAMFRRVNNISLHADHVSSYVMHDTARLNLGMDNERGTHSVEKSGDKVYLKIGKLMETNFEHKGPRKMIGGGGGCIFSTIAAKWTLLVFTFLNQNWGGRTRKFSCSTVSPLCEKFRGLLGLTRCLCKQNYMWSRSTNSVGPL